MDGIMLLNCAKRSKACPAYLLLMDTALSFTFSKVRSCRACLAMAKMPVTTSTHTPKKLRQ